MLEKPGTVIAVISDTHIGGKTALSLPEWTCIGRKGQQDKYSANPLQLWMWECWKDYWRYVCFLAGVSEGGKTRKHRIVVLHLGDMIDNYHHETIEAHRNPDDQIDMAQEILRPVANLADGGMFCTIGTEPTHAGPAGSFEYGIAKEIGAKDIDQVQLLSIDDIEILAYHHGRASQNPGTSVAVSMVLRARLRAQERGEAVPRYVFAGHNHKIDDSGKKDPLCQAVSMPSWQAMTAYPFKRSLGDDRSDIGGMIILPGGELDWSRSRYVGSPVERKVRIV